VSFAVQPLGCGKGPGRGEKMLTPEKKNQLRTERNQETPRPEEEKRTMAWGPESIMADAFTNPTADN